MKKLLLVFVLLLGFTSNANALVVDLNKGRLITLPTPAAHVYIADPAVADVDVRSSTQIYIYGVGAGETTIHAVDSNNREIFSDVVNVKLASGNLQKIIKATLPSSNVVFTPAGDSLILGGSVNSPQDAEFVQQIATSMTGNKKIINMMKISGSDQVMLRVRIAEVNRTALKNFGINLSSLFTRGSFVFQVLNGRDIVAPLTGAAAATFPNTDNNIRLGGTAGRFNITGVIDALETDGMVKTLAEPNLTAKSGSPASFLAGGEFPIPVPGENGTTTIEYKEFGVKLNFTPVVLSEKRISLYVAPEVSSITASTTQIQNNNIPTLSTRKASTTVELGSGESFAIAGLLQNEVSNSIDKFPWLGDVPVLGTLFRSHSFNNDETELVIIVTPYVVSPVGDPKKLLTPTEGLEIPSDFERILLGKMAKVKPAGRENVVEGDITKYKLNGNVGFVVGD